MKTAIIEPKRTPVRGSISPPTSKSLSNRSLLIAAQCNGLSRITGLLDSDDTRHMKDCLKAMGVDVATADGVTLVTGHDRFKKSDATLYVGNAGTVARFFVASAALCDEAVEIDGSPAMRKRPIAPLLEALRALGLPASSENGYFPISVGGKANSIGSNVEVDAYNSSQYVSALMMIGPLLPDGLTIRSKTPTSDDGFGYIDLTLNVMREFGARVHKSDSGHEWTIENVAYKPTDYTVEPDASGLTYIWALEAITDGQIDIGWDPSSSEQPDAQSRQYIYNYKNLPSELDCSMMQDSVPTIAVLAAISGRHVRLTGLRNLRVKECDRVAAIGAELTKFDERIVTIEGDDLVINGTINFFDDQHPIAIETYDDHRIAMAFALLGLVRHQVTILDPNCVAKTYPNYWNDLQTVGVSVQLA